MKIIVLLSLLFSLFTSCSDKRLDLKTYNAGDITVSWYHISEISTVHDFIEIERRGHKKNVMRANTGGIHNVLIHGDTVIIQTIPQLKVYELVTRAFDCVIIQDSSIFIEEYGRKLNSKSDSL